MNEVNLTKNFLHSDISSDLHSSKVRPESAKSPIINRTKMPDIELYKIKKLAPALYGESY